MANGQVPLCARQIFLYPGDPDTIGITGYDQQAYRDEYENLDFVNRSQILDALEDDIRTRDIDILNQTEEARFKIPEYQRYFTWELEQHEALWQDLLRMLDLQITTGQKPPENYFGTIYVGELGQQNRFEVIDGQQRITTFGIILENLRQVIEDLKEDLSGDIQSLAEHIAEDWLDEILYRRQGPDRVPFLEVNEHDVDFYKLIFNDENERVDSLYNLTGYDGRRSKAAKLGEVLEAINIDREFAEEHDEIEEDDFDNKYVYFAESHRRLIEANKFYKEKIDSFLDRDEFESERNKGHALINLTLYILRSLRVIEIVFEGDNRQLRVDVFQQLNERGKELSTMDKIRARIVSRFQDASGYDVEDELETWEEIVERFGAESAEVEDFLVNYLTATKDTESKTHAGNNLLDVFRLTDVGDPEIVPELTRPDEAHEFLEELDRYSRRFSDIMDQGLDGGPNTLSDNYRQRSEDILRRLDNLNTSQWIPFVLYLYDDVTQSAGKSEFFYEVMKTVETITFRVSITDLNATVIDETYIDSCNDFENRKEEEDSPYDSKEVSKILLNNVPDKRQLSGDTFAELLIRERGWSNRKVKQLFLKVVDEQFESDNTWTQKSISEEADIDVEHVFPTKFIRSNKSNPYVWLDDFFDVDGDHIDTNDMEIMDLVDELKDSDAANISEDDNSYDRIQRVKDHIGSRFVNDIGNMMVLVGGLNRSVKNKRFSMKLRQYHIDHSDDLNNPVNEFFSIDNSDINQSTIDELEELSVPDGYDDTDPSLGAIESNMNGYWNLNQLIERKTDIIESILESLTYSTGESEHEQEFDSLIGDLDAKVEEEMKKRAEQLV